MPIICNVCSVQIDEDEGNLEEHNKLAHEELIYFRDGNKTPDDNLEEEQIRG